MADYPQLFIRKSDLIKHFEYLDKRRETARSERFAKAADELFDALTLPTANFPEIEIILIQPEFTEHSRAVREILDDLEVDYRAVII